MKSIFPLLIIVFMISTSCDEGSFSWESNPPEVRLVILNESDLADKAIGDSINIELGLELYNMQNLYFLDFEIHFDHTKVPSTIRGETTVEWLKNIERSVGLEDLDENSYYPFEKIQKKISEKSENMLFIKLDTKKEDNDQFMKVDSAYFLEHASIDTFVKAIEMGHLQIEFNARTHHNHGTAFRTWERFLSSIWPDVEKI